MVQNIIVFGIILSSLIYGFYLVKKNTAPKKSSKCEGCDGCEIKKNIRLTPDGKFNVLATGSSHKSIIEKPFHNC